MKKISNFLEHKRSIAGVLLLTALVFNTYNIQENSVKIKRLTNFESGIQTCFSRVNQTYTAKILGDTASNYLTQNFQNLTEECFAEGILNIEDNFKIELSQVAKKLNTLASNVHWFHEDILSPGSARALANDGESRDVEGRFEKIETNKDEVLESSDKYKTEIANSLNTEKTIFYVSATLLVLLMFSEYMSSSRRRLSNSIREKEAEAELMDNGGIASVKVGDIIKIALEQNDLINCSKLFSNYHSHFSFDRKIKNNLSLESLMSPIEAQSPINTSETIAINEKIEKIWADDSIGLTADNSEAKILQNLNLENMSSNAIDLLAEKLFSRGIQLDIKIPENLMIKGRQEELEQILYHLLNYAINSTHSKTNENSISLFAHRLGDIVTFDLTYTGLGFDEEILKKRAGINSNSLNKLLDIDLEICETLLTEINAKFQLDNKLDQNGEIVGGRVKIIFKAVVATEARLVDLKVGSKKEILARLY